MAEQTKDPVWTPKQDWRQRPEDRDEARPHPGYRGEEYERRFFAIAEKAADAADPKRAEKEEQRATEDQWREVVGAEKHEEPHEVTRHAEVRAAVLESTGLTVGQVSRILSVPVQTVQHWKAGGAVEGPFARLLDRFVNAASRIAAAGAEEAEAMQAAGADTTGA